MAGLYGHKWTSAYGDNPVGIGGKEWALTLAGLRRDEIDAGLDACRNSADAWPPTAPQFKARCMGIPSVEFVRRDLPTREHGFTRMVWEHIDPWRFSRATTREAEQQFGDAYALAVERRMRGEAFPVEPPAIEHTKRPLEPSSREFAARQLAAIKAIVQASPPGTAAEQPTGEQGDD